MADPEQVSENFAVAKLFSILLVATGHYFEGSILWVPVSVALFVFAFSSGYFTAGRYKSEFKISSFFLEKVRRLFPSLFAINAFLFLVFLWEGRPNIVHPHAFVSMIGLVGFLDWLGIANASPFGNGLWFFTVLLLFYGFYPFLNFLCETKARSVIFIIVLGVLCILGQTYASPPYMLWLTVFGFGFGVFVSRVGWTVRVAGVIFSLVVVAGLFLGLNFFGFKLANIFLIAIISILVVGWLLVAQMPRKILGPLNWWLPCVLEIYFLHTYLFVRSEKLGVVFSYIVSMISIMCFSWLINRLSNSIKAMFAYPGVDESVARGSKSGLGG